MTKWSLWKIIDTISYSSGIRGLDTRKIARILEQKVNNFNNFLFQFLFIARQSRDKGRKVAKALNGARFESLAALVDNLKELFVLVVVYNCLWESHLHHFLLQRVVVRGFEEVSKYSQELFFHLFELFWREVKLEEVQHLI